MASLPYLLFAFVAIGVFLLSVTSKIVSGSAQRQRQSDRLAPQSLSASEAKSDRATTDKQPEHVTILPPSRRHVIPSLTRLKPSLEESSKEIGTNARTSSTGFTPEEIKQLGDFPDYAALSGVPLPDPYPEFDIERALPRPYRPFRWAYHQTMAYTKLEPNWWLELHRDYASTIKQRIALYEQHSTTVVNVLPGSEGAVKELMEMVIQFLCARYPHYFHLDPPTLIFHNSILKTTTELRSTPPMMVLLYNIPEDFALMLRCPDTGLYSFRAGIIMSSLSWTLGTKLGLTISEIHGPVPDYEDKLQFSMDRFFAKMVTDKPIQRGSWGLETDKPLFVPPGDPAEAVRMAQDPELTLDRIHLRVDWQTLRRLPLSGAVAFNFKALFTPLEEFRDEPKVPALMVKLLKEGKENIMEYKGSWHVKHVALPTLEEWQKEQVEKGMVEEDWDVATLDDSPFFEGWEEKWRLQQGF